MAVSSVTGFEVAPHEHGALKKGVVVSVIWRHGSHVWSCIPGHDK